MITIIYGYKNSEISNGKTNIVLPDYEIDEFVKNLTDDTYYIGCELIITAIRATTNKESIKGFNPTVNGRHIEILFKEEDVGLNYQGRCNLWPVGFCDQADNYYSALL